MVLFDAWVVLMYLFSWNLHKRWSQLQLALLDLYKRSQRDHVIATLQEWPKSWGPAQKVVGDYMDVVSVLERVVVLHSKSLKLVTATQHPSERAVVARFQTNGGSELNFVALHWYSRVEPGGYAAAEERGALAALFRHSIDTQVGDATPAVVMGDFNAPWGAMELKSPWCLYAVDARYRPVPRHKAQWSGAKEPWHLVTLEQPGDVGTHFFQSREEWLDIDHVAVTHHLKNRIVKAQIVTEFEGQSLLTAPKRVPVGKHDHLPIACELHFQ